MGVSAGQDPGFVNRQSCMCTGFAMTGSSGVDETFRQWIMKLVIAVNPGRDVGHNFIFFHCSRNLKI